jgi:hypothetical protein
MYKKDNMLKIIELIDNKVIYLKYISLYLFEKLAKTNEIIQVHLYQ